MLPAIIYVIMLVGINSQHLHWFKNTSLHQINIQKLNNGWVECPEWKTLSVASSITLFSFGSSNTIPIPAQNNSLYNITALCITLQVPLNWDDRNTTNINSTIDYHISRLFSGFNPNNTKGNGAFWMLQGGPGVSGSTLYPIGIPVMNLFDDKFDLYIPDHRGTGHSNYLYCNHTTFKSCAKDITDTYGDTSYFSTYAASMDLGYVVDLFQKRLDIYNSTNDIVYGVSYGTYYLNQYLTLFPNQFKASIFDSMTSPEFRFSQFGNDSNQAGLEFLQKCHENGFCNKLFTELNTTIFDAINVSFTELPCFEPFQNLSAIFGDDFVVGLLRGAFASSLQDIHKRVLIPPMVYRMNRCNKDDQEAVVRYLLWASGLGALFNMSASSRNASDIPNLTNSPALYNNIVFSEMWDSFNTSDPGATYEEMVESESKSYFSGTLSRLRKGWDDWIRYTPKPALFYQYANPPTPMLLFGAGIDPQTNIKYSLRSAGQYRARMGYGKGNRMGNRMDNTSNTTNRYFYEFPDSPHAVIVHSLINNFTDSTLGTDYNLQTCALYIIKSFIDPNNNYTPNSECFSWLTDIDWNGTSNISQQLGLKAFGTMDVWGTQAVESAAPTETPVDGNVTYSPTISPTVKTPTQSPTDDETTWFITGIVFICLFAVALIVICYLAYVLMYSNQKVSDSQGDYTKTNNTDVEVGNLKTTVAEDSD
eukprot:351641_1